MTAYWVVLAAVALTTLVAAVVGATLAASPGRRSRKPSGTS